MTISATKAASAAALIPAVLAVATSAASAAPAPPTKNLTWASGGARCGGVLKIENINGTATATSSALCTVSQGAPPMAQITVSFTAPGPNGAKDTRSTKTYVNKLPDDALIGGGNTQVTLGMAIKGNYTVCTRYENKAGTALGAFSGTASGNMACVTGPIK